jgi:ParB family chromosome partitioning protein
MPQEYGLGRGLASLIPQKKQPQNQNQDQDQTKDDDKLSAGAGKSNFSNDEFSDKWEEKIEFKKKGDAEVEPKEDLGEEHHDLIDKEEVDLGNLISEKKPGGLASDSDEASEDEEEGGKEEEVKEEKDQSVDAADQQESVSSTGDVNTPGEVDVEKVKANPFQPRTNFDERKLEELSQSIKRHGVIQPLIVTKKGEDFELIAGERRLQAAKKAGVTKVPVVVKDVDDKDKMEWAIIENIQRHDLNPIEEARAYKRLMDESDLHQDEVAQKMGKSRSFVANKVRLLELPSEAQKALIEERITEGHAKAILSLSDSEKQRGLLELILKNNLTVRQTEKRSGEIEVKKHKRKVNQDPYTKELEDRLQEGLGTKVRVRKSGGEGGNIVIEYYSREELNGIMDKIAPREVAQRK